MRSWLRATYRYWHCQFRPRVLLVMYHHVCPHGGTVPGLTVPPEQFEEQMAFLARRGMALSMDELLDSMKGGRRPRGGRVVVTLDDGAEDTLQYAAPILRRHRVPATVFVPTGLCGGKQGFWWNRLYVLAEYAACMGCDLYDWVSRSRPDLGCPDPRRNLWKLLRLLPEREREEVVARASARVGHPELPLTPRPMTREEVNLLGKDGLITLGAHTVTHPMLEAISDARLAEELTACRGDLAGLPAYRNVFAYPYGDPAVVTPRTRQAARDAGFDAAFTIAPGPVSATDDPWALPRVGIEDCTLAAFRWTIDHYLCRPNSPDHRSARGAAAHYRNN